MKIITIAAGAGVRLASESPPVPRPKEMGRVPKAMYPLLSRPLVSWSASIYSEWIKSGLVNFSDFIFVVQKAHDEEYQIVDHIRKHVHAEVTVVTIPKLSSGPAATAAVAVKHIDENEEILINDCDHYYSSAGLMKSLRRRDRANPDVLIATTNPHNDIPTWSYAVLKESSYPRLQLVEDIREKDPALASAGAPGVIGAYYFKTAGLYMSLYKEAFSSTCGERYVSHVIKHAISSNHIVMSAKSNYGYPLGTLDEIETFKFELVQKRLNQKSENYFVNLNVVFPRLDLNGRGEEKKDAEPRFDYLIDEVRASEFRQLYQTGNTLIFFSEIPETYCSEVVSLLEGNKVPYDNLLLGVSSGVSTLLASSKKGDLQYDVVSSDAIDDFIQTNITVLPKVQGHKMLRDLTSGSGAITVRLSDEFGESFIRKYCSLKSTAKNEKVIDVLKLQARWLEDVHNNFPGNVPRVVRVGETDRFFCLDMEDLGELPTLYRVMSGNDLNEQQKYDLLDKLLSLVGSIYGQTTTGPYPDDGNAVIDLILNKALPAVRLLYNSADFISQQLDREKWLILNDRKVENPLNKLSSIVERIETGLLDIGGLQANLFCTIHGDLTAENVLINREGEPILIDPLAATMDLSAHEQGKLVREKSTPFFDYLKLMQSFVTNYEKWNAYEKPAEVDENRKLWYNEGLVSRHDQVVSQIKKHYQEFGVDTGDRNTKLMLAILLMRIIPYKIQAQQNQALMCFCIATELLEDI